MAESAVTTTMAAVHVSMVLLLPAASESGPSVSAPAITPPMNRLMVSGESQARSHTSCHSETMVDSESASGNSRRWHLEDRPDGERKALVFSM